MRRIFLEPARRACARPNSNVPLRIKLVIHAHVTSDPLIDVAAALTLNSDMNVTNIAPFIIPLFMVTAPLNSATLIFPAPNGNDMMWLFESLVNTEGSLPAIDVRYEDLSESANQWNWMESLTVTGTTSATFGICSEAAVLCDSLFESITFTAHEVGAWLELPGDYQADVKLWLTEIGQNPDEFNGQSRQSGDAPEPTSLYLTAVALGIAAARARSKLFEIRIRRGVPFCRSG